MGYRSSKKSNITPIESPCRKAIYNSREDAQAMINYIKETRISKEIHAYKCPVCGFWHLTSRSS